jgi:hypothetical protein
MKASTSIVVKFPGRRPGMRTRTELLVFLTLWCATLPLVVSLQSKNGLTCSSSGCGSTFGTTGTWCWVPTDTSGFFTFTCPSGSTKGFTGCWDWCGYRYTKTGSFDVFACFGQTEAGSGLPEGVCYCTTYLKPDAADCGPSSGHKRELYKCVDSESNNGDKCTGPVPEPTYVDCEKTACPPPSCSSDKCVGRTGIYCDNLVITGGSGVSIINNGCSSTISSNVQGCCDCGGCSASSMPSGKQFSSSALFFCLQFMASTPDARPSDKFAVCPGRCTKFSLPFFAE